MVCWDDRTSSKRMRWSCTFGAMATVILDKDSGWVEDIATIVLLGPLVDDGFVVEGVIQ